MSATMILGVMGAIAAGAVTSLLTKETEGLIDALPGLMLRLARRHLPVDGRDDLYEEWSAELHIALHETEGRPLGRLLLGVRYAAGLLRTARRIADELGSTRNAAPDPWEDPATVVPGELTAGQGGFSAPLPWTSGSTVYAGPEEEEASRIRAYGAGFIPALLQTEDYVRAMTALGHPWASAREIEHRVSIRMRRHASLHGDDPPPFWTLVRLDQLTSSLYLDKREDVDNYWRILEQLCIEAEPAAATQDDLAGILRQL